MHKGIKNEIGKVYGDIKVIAITDRREPTNGCVIWECECKYCGTISYHNGNLMRFDFKGVCPVCSAKRKKARR